MFGSNLKRNRSKGVMLALAGALALTACSGATETDESIRDDAGNIVEEGGDVGVFVMQVGDCFDEALSSEVESLGAIPCAEDHELEVYAKFNMPEGDFPGNDAVTSAAEDGCLERFSDYVGIDYSESNYYYTFLSPTEDGWNIIEDREIVCLLTTVGDEPNTGTGKDSRI